MTVQRIILTFCICLICIAMRAQEAVPDSINFHTIKETSDIRIITSQKQISSTDSAEALFLSDNIITLPTNFFKPDPQKSLWYALLFPGLGQIYNRRYWKVPIVYSGVAVLTYAITWNGKNYNAYSRAYRDYMDSDPNTTSYESIFPPNYSESSKESYLQQKQNSYRRNRDLAIIGTVAFYAITVMDAFVDAQLADFDISPDLSLRVAPTLLQTPEQFASMGMKLRITF